jgi:hypothetical protein
MKKYLVGFWYSMPIQLFLLHFRKYQVFLIFWYILFATINGNFLEKFGANSLFLAPEYFNNVNFLSTIFVGLAIGMFIMSWNITTFILHHNDFQFLATTAQPFLKYCINNSILPFIFLVNYFSELIYFDTYRELMSSVEITWLLIGFLVGFFLAIFIAFAYFFGADKTIYSYMGKTIKDANNQYLDKIKNSVLATEKYRVRIDWFLTARFALRKPRDVRHYSQDFLDSIFKTHHFAAVIAYFIAFVFLIGIGYTSDARLSQIPAAASVTIFFALIIAVVGAFSVFLKNWSLPIIALIYLLFNILYEHDIIDPRTKFFGLDYTTKINDKPIYSKEFVEALANDSAIELDKQKFIGRLNAWKARQQEEKPIFYIINTSGGGIRSATFTFRTLQYIDSLMNGKLMSKTMFINGASGGMLGASYYRALYQKKLKQDTINLQSSLYINDISKDLLNPIFSSFVARDIIAPVQKFTVGKNSYVKDRAYAFEQKLNVNTHGVLDKNLESDRVAEEMALIPTMFYNSVITRDGRKMILCSQPVRFLMRAPQNKNSINSNDPDAIDFNSFFAKQNAMNIQITSALRINATFPYILPNAQLPTTPVIDIMDAGLRDNFGQENTLRFIEVFKDWLLKNTSKIVIIQIRDRTIGDWEKPLESKSLIDLFTRPAFLLQNNWYKLQDYSQNDQLDYFSKNFGNKLAKINFQYLPSNKDAAASLSFHLTAREKKEIAVALNNDINKKATTELMKIDHSFK